MVPAPTFSIFSLRTSSCSDCRLSSAFQKAQRWKLLSLSAFKKRQMVTKPIDFGFPPSPALTGWRQQRSDRVFQPPAPGPIFSIFWGEISAVQKIEVSQETFRGPRYASLKILILSMCFFTCCFLATKGISSPHEKKRKKTVSLFANAAVLQKLDLPGPQWMELQTWWENPRL